MTSGVRRYAARMRAHNVPRSMPAGALRQLYVEVSNDGDWTWPRLEPPGPSVDLAFYVDGSLVTTIALPDEALAPGETALFSFKWRAPAREGTVNLAFDMVEQNVTFFAPHQGALSSADVCLTAAAGNESSRLFEISAARNYWFYLPTEGVIWSSYGRSYPLFVANAVGPTFRDVEGRDYLDYVMGWGSCLLGYAHPRVQAAVAAEMATSPLATLPYAREIELSEALAAHLPSAEMSAFGKNGSDVTTVAVRLARAATGRSHVLYSGFHGWQDWNTQLGTSPIQSSAFGYGDLAAADDALARHDGDVAAIVVEPAAQVEGVQGPVRAADAAFLRGLRARCDARGIVLVFDEIWTGFRYLDGSVQQHARVTPDLTCLGKALSNGYPLAAVVGKRDVFTAAIHRIAYTPTFKGETYSFAAALAALAVYRETDVAAAVWAYGRRLMDGISRLCLELDVPGRMTGVPPRAVFAFDLGDAKREALARTLLTQELLREGLLVFRGFFIPSLAHGDDELIRTLAIAGRALEVVGDTLKRDAFAERLEIPIVR